jgi:hypothetical protein
MQAAEIERRDGGRGRLRDRSQDRRRCSTAWGSPTRSSRSRSSRLSGGQKGASPSPSCCSKSPTSCSWTNRPTTSISTDACGSRRFSASSTAARSSMISHDRYILDNVVDEHHRGRARPPDRVPRQLRRLPRDQEPSAAWRSFARSRTSRAASRRKRRSSGKYKAGQRAKPGQGPPDQARSCQAEFTLERPMELASFALELPKAERTGDVVISAARPLQASTEPTTARRSSSRTSRLKIARGERWGSSAPTARARPRSSSAC